MSHAVSTSKRSVSKPPTPKPSVSKPSVLNRSVLKLLVARLSLSRLLLSRTGTRKGLGRCYSSRWDIVQRTFLACVGGYVLAALFTVFVSTLPLDAVPESTLQYGTQDLGSVAMNVMTATQYSFLIMAIQVIWAFCASSGAKVWSVTLAAVALLVLAIGVNHAF